EAFKNEFININPKTFAILTPPLRRIDRLNVKEELAVLFINSKKGNELKNLLNNKINSLYSLLKKYNFYLELTPFQSNWRGSSKSKFINNDEVYRLLLERIENFPSSFYDSTIELNKKVSFFNDLVNSIENYKIRDKINNEYSNYFNECKELIDKLKEEKITTSFDSSNPPYFKIIDEKKFKNKIEKLKQEYIDKISDPVIDNLLEGRGIRPSVTPPQPTIIPSQPPVVPSQHPDTPPYISEEVKVFLGSSEDGENIYWYPGRLPNGHLIIIGSAGSGKTETIRVITSEFNKCGYPVLLIDFHGDMGISGVEMKTYNIKEGSEYFFNPLELDPRFSTITPLKASSDFVDSIFINFPTLGIQQRDRLKEIISKIYSIKGITRELNTWNKEVSFKEIQQIIEESDDDTISTLKGYLRDIFDFELFTGEKKISISDIFLGISHFNLKSLPESLKTLYADLLLRKLFYNLQSMEKFKGGVSNILMKRYWQISL
ncbi:MAG: DUF853 family protein, partial [Candidatus Methanoperedens sp.]|nr:DUF853 family protein [Candidatus Methanoperedens sp.]